MIRKKYILIIFIFNLLLFYCVPPYIGYAQKKKGKKEISVQDVCKDGCPDSDGDGVPNYLDKCPNIPGAATSHGCPDSDGDGIADYVDDCPNLFGLPEFNGCPDSDGDGISDNLDVCPNEPGPRSNNGCPELKTFIQNELVETNSTPPEEEPNNLEYEDKIDLDHSVVDKSTYSIYEQIIDSNYSPDVIHQNDKANNLPKDIQLRTIEPNKQEIKPDPLYKSDYSISSNFVLPASEKAYMNLLLHNISFEPGRNKMDDNSKQSIISFAEILKKYPNWKLVIHSYAYDADSDYRNLQLSENRAIYIKSALVKQFIENNRIETIGHGSIDKQYSNRECYILFQIK